MASFEHWVQSRLTAHGFPVGPIDGKFGENSKKALKAFEAWHGFTADGVADEKVVKALRQSASALAPGTATEIPDRNEEIELPTTRAQDTWPRQKDVPLYFGPVGTSQVQVEIPFEMVLAWDKDTRVRKITLHKLVAASAKRAFEMIEATYSHAERVNLGINLFGGSLNVRRMRGGKSFSMHSWGIAIDFAPERNQLKWGKPRARLSHEDAIPFWKCWEDEGWLSLGRQRNFDWMHVQAARL